MIADVNVLMSIIKQTKSYYRLVLIMCFPNVSYQIK
jgi:hypothetical protein